MTTPRQRCPEKTRQRLLEAAHREMYEYGFQGASLQRILASTGLTKGALYHHFKAKQALGIAVVEEVIGARLKREWIEPVLQAPDPLDKLVGLLERTQMDTTVHSIRLGCDLNNLMQEMSPIDDKFRDALAAVVNEWRTGWERALQRAKQAGALRPDIDCGRAALFLIAALEGCLGLNKTQLDVADFRHCLEGLKDYLDTLRAR